MCAHYFNTTIKLMQTPIPTESHSLMRWMILMINHCIDGYLYKLVCCVDILFILSHMHASIHQVH